MSKLTCPVSKSEFFATARTLPLQVGDQSLAATAREFSTGSYGYNAAGKATIMIDGKPVQAQVSVNITLIGSKPR